MTEISTLQKIDLEELLNVFNEAFSDYFVPFQLTLEQLKVRLKSDKVRWDYSVGAYENEKLVGFIIHGFDVIDGKRVVYNGGTGVIPSFRGLALTQKMYDFILPSLRKEKLDYLLLEVITKNVPAIKTYERAGFVIHRKVVCYKGDLRTKSQPGIRIEKLNEYDWKKLESFWDFIPTWQNSKNVLDELKDRNESYAAYIDDRLVGYIVYNPASKRIQQFATDKNFRRKNVATTLFDFIGNKFGNAMMIINVDSESVATDNFLNSVGLQNFVEQFEMRLAIN